MSQKRSLLIIPGNNPKRLQNAPVFNPDLLVLDLADGVKAEDKDCARFLTKEAIQFLDYEKVQVVVRVNTLASGYGAKDIEVVTRVKPSAFMIPKATVAALQEVEKLLSAAEKEAGIPEGEIKLIPVIETIEALEGVAEVLRASARIEGAFLNAEGLTKELGITRTREGEEILYARSKVAMACRVAGVSAFDTAFLDGNDYDGLERDAIKARNFGFTGKAAIDGRQIDTIHKVFASF